MDAFASRFGQIYGSIKKKPYDILDQRKTDFDGDFEDFLRQMRDLEVKFTLCSLDVDFFFKVH